MPETYVLITRLVLAGILGGLMGHSTFALTDIPTENGCPYASEADSFLAKRDGSVQPRQIAAILEATAGRTNDLNGVRQARNAMAPIPDCVEAEMVSPKMRLYRPKGGHDLPLLVYLHGGGWVIGSTHLFVTVPGQPAAFRRAVDFAYEAVGGLVPNCK